MFYICNLIFRWIIEWILLHKVVYTLIHNHWHTTTYRLLPELSSEHNGQFVIIGWSTVSHKKAYRRSIPLWPYKMFGAESTNLPLQVEHLSAITEKSPEPGIVNVIQKEASEADILWVDWDGPKDPMNPKKWAFASTLQLTNNSLLYSSWSYRQKWATTIIVSALTLVSPVSSSMIAPAAAQVAKEFGITSNVLVAMTTSIFVLGYGKHSPFTFHSWIPTDSHLLFD